MLHNFIGIKDKKLIFELTPPTDVVYTKLRNTAKGTFLIAITYPYVEFYYWDTLSQGAIRVSIKVAVNGEVVEQEWKDLWSSNYMAISSVLRSNGYVPYELVPVTDVTTGREWHVFKDYLHTKLPLDVELYKDAIGAYNARFKKTHQAKG
jgi:hypothetical protein